MLQVLYRLKDYRLSQSKIQYWRYASQFRIVEPNDAYGKDVNFTFYDTGRITYVAEIIGVKKYGETILMKSLLERSILS